MKNIFSNNIKARLVAMFLLISIAPLLVVAGISYFSAQQALEKQFIESFKAVSQGKEESVLRYMRTKMKVTKGFASDMFIRSTLEKIEENGSDSEVLAAQLSKYILEDKFPVDIDIDLTHVINLEGRIIASTDKASIGTDKSNDDYFIEGRKVPHVKDAYISPAGTECIAVSVPLKSIKTGNVIGVIVNRFTTKELNVILTDQEGMGKTGETYIVNKDGYMITDSRFTKDTFLKQKVDTEPVKLFREHKKEMEGLYTDYRGSYTLGISNGEKINDEFNLGWAIMVEIDTNEAFAPVTKLLNVMLLVMLLVALLVIVFAMKISETITSPIKQLSDIAVQMAKGDLTGKISVKSSDEIGLLAKSFDTMLQNIKTILAKTQDAVNQITSASAEILAASQEQAAGAREQSAAVSETTSAAKELSKSAEQIGESVKRVSEVSGHAMLGMAKIKESIGKTNQIIGSLSEKSQKIGKITELIDDVADQTNLLAVNAAIEAARAGEEGRGFTVVADEIRKLADSTAKSTKDITALIEIIQHEMTNVIMSMETSISSVEEETKLSQESAERSKEISMNSTQQISGSKQIADAMTNIDETMKQIAASAQQSQVVVKQLTGLSNELKEIIGKFKIS